MIEHLNGHVYLFAICVLFSFLCVLICVVLGCVHILGALATAITAGVLGYRTLLVIANRRLPFDLTPILDVYSSLAALPTSASVKKSQRVDLVDDRPSSSNAQQLDHGAEEHRFQNERSASGVMYEVDLFVQYVMKDFVVSWYAGVSSNEQFLREIQYALEDLSVALVSRVRKLDARVLLRKAFHIYHTYFLAYRAASANAKETVHRSGAMVRKGDRNPSAENFFTDWHFALESGQTEMQHLHNMVNVLLEVLLPADVLSCSLWRKLVVDLLACKLLHPLVNLLSDPIYLNQKINSLIVDPNHRKAEVTLRDSCLSDRTVLAEAAEPQSSAKRTYMLATEVSRHENREDRTPLDSCGSLGDDIPPNAQDVTDSAVISAEEFSASPDLIGNDEQFFEDSTFASDDVTDGIWQRLADELPSTFWCEREQEVNEMVQEASASLELKKKLKLPLSGSIDKISDLFSGTISFDSISNNIAQYFKSASEEDKSSLNTQASADDCQQLSAEGSTEDDPPREGTSEQTGTDSKVIYGSNEDEQRSDPEFHVKSVLERLFHMTTGPVLSEHTYSITNSVIDKEEEKRDLTPLTVSESVESNEFDAPEDLECKGSQEEKLCLDVTDGFKIFYKRSPKTPTSCSTPVETSNVALFTTTFSNLHISGTEVIDDVNSGAYVVYCITYEVHFQNNDVIDAVESENYISSLELQTLTKTCFVRRRFREFVTLQSRLEDDPKLRGLMKGIKGPNKWTMLPFNKLDKDAISERKQVLEHYLQILLAKDAIASSIHFKEFLAYGNDPSIAYVRKAADVGLPVPRIDKFLMKTMTGVFDKLKTALPSLPHDLSPVEPFMNAQQKTSERFLGFLNFNSGIADENALRINFDFEPDRDYHMCVEDQLSWFLNSFERNNEPVDSAYDVAADIDNWSSPSDCEKLNSNFEASLSGAVDTPINDGCIGCDKFIDDDIPLASAIINFIVETIQKEDTTLNRESFILMVKIMFGQILERWMCEVVAMYTCEKMFAKYLKIIRESIWPNGSFGIQATVPPSESDRKRICTETLQGLKSCVPGFIAILLGKSQCHSGMELVFDSFQHPKMLRHFIYHLLDLLVEALLIRSRSQSIIDKLSSLS